MNVRENKHGWTQESLGRQIWLKRRTQEEPLAQRVWLKLGTRSPAGFPVRLNRVAPVLFAVLLAGGAQTALAQRTGDRHPGDGAPSGAHAPARNPPAGGPNQHLDSRFSHNRYYFDRGYAVRRPPPGGFGEFHGHDGDRYRFYSGNWYRWRGNAWVVWGAPFGVFVPFLPPYYTTVWWRGVPYYYANDTYYSWDGAQNEYAVVAPPDGIESSGTTQSPPSNQLFVYPKNGQSSQQQDLDRYQCHAWAVSKSGFDPTLSGGGVAPEVAVDKRNAYYRAEVACLEGRGYSVK